MYISSDDYKTSGTVVKQFTTSLLLVHYVQSDIGRTFWLLLLSSRNSLYKNDDRATAKIHKCRIYIYVDNQTAFEFLLSCDMKLVIIVMSKYLTVSGGKITIEGRKVHLYRLTEHKIIAGNEKANDFTRGGSLWNRL